MSSNNASVFDHTGDDFIPLYDIPSEEIDGTRSSSISDFIKEGIHPPTTGYRLVAAEVWIEAIPNLDNLKNVSKQFADKFRIEADKVRKIMNETDSLMPLDHHIIPIIDEYLSSLPDLPDGQGFSVQLQAELTINLKDVKREGGDKNKDVKGEDNPPKKRRKINYLIFRVDRAWGLTFTLDEHSSQSSKSHPARDDPLNARITVSRDDAESNNSQRDDDEPEDADMAALPDQLVSRDSEIPADEMMDDDQDTDNIISQREYGKRSKKYLLAGDDGIPGRTKVFCALEGKMAGNVFRCRDNLIAVATHGAEVEHDTMSLLKQGYTYALSYRTQFVALYDYTTLVLIRWNHLNPDETAAELFNRWNKKSAAAQLDREIADLTVVVDRNLTVSSLAGFLIKARQECPLTWRP
ncbi:hypothetical protein CcaCcLH18_09646 [Colletotrichum camelliae]|nr:hypothetical protein CcaCcLH18_09646 [Colletotrichum camelliae]